MVNSVYIYKNEIFLKDSTSSDIESLKKFENTTSLKSNKLEDITIGIPSEYHCEGLSEEILNLWSEIAILFQDAGIKVKFMFFVFIF